MKRDFDLIRTILVQCEEATPGQLLQTFKVDESASGRMLAEHVQLLIQAGFIDGEVYSVRECAYVVEGLTWAGHDFLDAMKDDTIWSKAKDTILKPVGGIAFDVLKQWLVSEAKRKLGLPTEY